MFSEYVPRRDFKAGFAVSPTIVWYERDRWFLFFYFLVFLFCLFFCSFFLGCDSVWHVQVKWIDVLGSVDNPRRQFVKIAEHSWAFFLPFSVRNWVRSDNTEQHGLRTVVLFSEVPNSRWTFAPLKSGHWHNTLHRWTCCNKSNTFLHLRDSFPNGDEEFAVGFQYKREVKTTFVNIVVYCWSLTVCETVIYTCPLTWKTKGPQEGKVHSATSEATS